MCGSWCAIIIIITTAKSHLNGGQMHFRAFNCGGWCRFAVVVCVCLCSDCFKRCIIGVQMQIPQIFCAPERCAGERESTHLLVNDARDIECANRFRQYRVWVCVLRFRYYWNKMREGDAAHQEVGMLHRPHWLVGRKLRQCLEKIKSLFGIERLGLFVLLKKRQCRKKS